MSSPESAAKLSQMVLAFQTSQVIYVAVQLGFVDHLKDGARTSDDLARATKTPPKMLYRLLRAAAAVGIVQEGAGKHFSVTPLGDCLRSDAPYPVGPLAKHFGSPHIWQAWGDLLHSVRTGETAFQHVHGMTNWEYYQKYPEAGAVFDTVQTAQTRGDLQSIMNAYDFSSFGHVIDVGGGAGSFLTEILKANAQIRGTLFDQPDVISRAPAPTAGIAHRYTMTGGSFFDSVPKAGDAYLLKHILHDWDDDACGTILRMIRKVIKASGRLLVFERIISPPNEGALTKLSDLNMMCLAGGEERSADEFASLLASTGFRLERVVSTTGRDSVVEATPV